MALISCGFGYGNSSTVPGNLRFAYLLRTNIPAFSLSSRSFFLGSQTRDPAVRRADFVEI